MLEGIVLVEPCVGNTNAHAERCANTCQECLQQMPISRYEATMQFVVSCCIKWTGTNAGPIDL